MENTFDYQSVPSGYSHCFNSQCVKSNECLRYLVAVNSTSDPITLNIINPHRIPADTSECLYFKSIKKLRVAWGVKKLFDNMPYKAANVLRKEIVEYFGKTAYYRFYRHEHGIMPEDQNYIRRVFTRHGITEEPDFESYTDQYNYFD